MVEICLTKVLIISVVLQVILVAIVCKLLSQINAVSSQYQSQHEYSKHLLTGCLFTAGITLLILIISIMYIYNNDNSNSQPEVTSRVSFKNIDYL
jgi:uncharacterized membrane protein YciS (DUF1049 family)